MPGHSLSPFTDSESETRLTQAVTEALEFAPVPAIPADFARRVASQLPPLALPAIPPRHHGRNAAIASMAVLLLLIAAFAHRATVSSPLWMAAEAIFCLQLSCIAVWLVARTLQPIFTSHSNS